MLTRSRSLSLLVAAACGAIAAVSSAQTGTPQPAGPHEALGLARPYAERPDLSQSALLQAHTAPPGGFSDLSPSTGAGALLPADPGAGGRSIDQPPRCGANGWYSNVNSNDHPYLVFDDFVADDNPLGAVQFYGGVYGGSLGLSAVDSFTIEIWTIDAGGECGWVYGSPVHYETFYLAQTNPTFECKITNANIDAYQFTANLWNPIQLVPGQNYMITIYARLFNPDGDEAFVLAETASPHNNPATSWDRTTWDYVRCSPDMAFRTIPGDTCQEADPAAGAYFSNLSNASPYLSFDDFTAARSGLLERIQVTAGMYDAGTGTGTDFDNIAALKVDIYDAYAEPFLPCGSWYTGIIGEFDVLLDDAMPRYEYTDSFGISYYTFTIEVPESISLQNGGRYFLNVYGLPVNPNIPELFAWGCTNGIRGFTSWSVDFTTGIQSICHDMDMAFCIDPERPCFADFNEDGEVDTRDVLAFLNAWVADDLAADMDHSVHLDTRDVINFLNVWNTDCVP